MKKSTLAAVAALILGAALPVQATELKLGMSAPEPTPWANAAKKMAEIVADKSGGELTLSLYFSNQLGDGQTMARQLARGRLDMAVFSNVEASLLVPEFGLLNSPYLFQNHDQVVCMMGASVSETFTDLFTTAGAVYLAPVDVGAMEIMSKKEFGMPGDLANEKIRTSPAPTDTYYLESTGAAAVPLSVPDTMPALKTGAVVAITTPLIMGVAGGYWAEAPNIIMTDHSYQIGALLISKATWDGLNDNQRNALTEGAKAMDVLTNAVPAVEKMLLDKAVAGGARVHNLSDEQKAAWIASAAGAQDKIVASSGDDATAIWAKLQAASAECAK